MCAPLFRGQNTETRELSAYPAEPNQIKGKIKRSTEVMDLLFFIFVHPSLINMHNKYFWTSTLLGVPRWESLMRINNLVETLFTILFLLPIKAVTKTEAPPCYTLGETTPSEMFTVCKYSRPWRERESENNADDLLCEELEMILMNPGLTGTWVLQF